MMQINLLPWREHARKVNKSLFFIWMGGFIGLALFFLFVIHIRYDLVLRAQQSLNNYLKTEINQEQTQLSSLDLEQQSKLDLESHLRFIINLQAKNFRAIRLLNELAAIVPSTLSLNKIIRNDNKITLSGVAKTDADVSLFKQKIAQSRFFDQPVLTEISAEKNVSTINFTLEVVQKDIL